MRVLTKALKKAQENRSPKQDLLQAIIGGDYEGFKTALKEVGDINCMLDGQTMAAATPLIHASYCEGSKGHEDIFDYIIAQPEVNLSAVAADGRAAPLICAYNDRTDRIIKIEQAQEKQHKAKQAHRPRLINPDLAL